MRFVLCLLVISSALVTNGCWFRKKPKAQAPPPPPPAPQIQAPRAPSTQPAATPPKVAPAKRRPAASTQRAAPPAAIPPKAAETKKPQSVAKPEEPQQFGRILSTEEKTEYRATYERSSAAAREILSTLTGRQLGPSSLESIGRIRSFLAQAQEALTSDLPAAAQLAYRAEILARDLTRLLQ